MQKIYTRQLGFFFFMAIPLTKLILLPSLLSTQTDTSSIFVLLIYFLLDALLLFAVFRIRKLTNGKSIFHSLEKIISKPGTRVAALIYLVYFLLRMFYTLTEQKLFAGDVFYEMLPKTFLLVPIVVTVAYVSRKGLTAIGRNCDILFPLFALSYLIIIFLGAKNSTFSDILPLTSPITYECFIQNSQYFGETLVALFIIPQIEPTKNFKKKSFKSPVCISSGASTYVLTGITLLVTTMIFAEFLMSFGCSSYLKRYAITALTAASATPSRADFFPIVYMLSGVIVYLSMVLYICLNLFCFVFKTNRRTFACVILSSVLFALTIVFGNNFTAVLKLFKILNPVFLVLTYVLPVIFAILIKLTMVKKNEKIKT